MGSPGSAVKHTTRKNTTGEVPAKAREEAQAGLRDVFNAQDSQRV